MRVRLSTNRLPSSPDPEPNTSRWITARSPTSSAAIALAPVKLASATVVVPPARHSAAPRRASASVDSQSSRRLRSTWRPIQGPNGRPSPKPE